MRLPGMLLLVATPLACGSDAGREQPDATTATRDAAASTDAPGLNAEANILAALACGSPLPITGVAQPGELQLHRIDTATFPDALCNDGTPAILFYRPYRGEANRKRWVIGLRGGGNCSSAASCAARWCSCDTTTRCPFASATTNFDINNMSGGGDRSHDGNGILLRDGPMPNPLADYNQVQLVYCSSDLWRSAVRAISYSTTHPRTGAPVSYTIHFLGARILDADLRTLRQDGVPALSYVTESGATPMPDLDDAVDVVLAGDSAGGAGVIHNLDYVAGLLPGAKVAGLMDAIIGPEMSRLDWSKSAGAGAGIDSYEKFVAASEAAPIHAGARRDASCVAWHAAHRPGTEAECGETMHVVRNHVTTPFFLRVALLDSNVSQNYEEAGLADPVRGAFVDNAMGLPAVFGLVLQPEIAAFPLLATTAEEGSAITVAPGTFAPSCTKHDTLYDNNEVYGVTITPTGSRDYRLFDVWNAWRSGDSPAAVVSSDPTRADTFCPR